jgi:aconitate hydratase
LPELQAKGLADLSRLLYSIRILLESVVRQCDQGRASLQDLMNLCAWQPHSPRRASIPFRPARILMQDYTGVPAMVDLAAMRSALQRLGGDPRKVNPVVPVDLVIDHSVRVDFFASQDALRRNVEIEIGRNRERYEFLRWAQNSFDNFRVIPPSSGIVHQVNLERLAQVVVAAKGDGYRLAFPDTVLGTDSHTTMANGLGILGWGVGGSKPKL